MILSKNIFKELQFNYLEMLYENMITYQNKTIHHQNKMKIQVAQGAVPKDDLASFQKYVNS